MKDGRNKILKAAYELLCEVKDPAKVTIREIAKRAGVGTGLFNYYFSNKDALLMEAVGKALSEVAVRWKNDSMDLRNNPLIQLKQMLSELMELGAEQFYLIQLASKFELTEGEVNTPRFILPYILQISGKEEKIARMIALSMISNLQTAALRNKQFLEYMGLDLLVRDDRQKYIDYLIESHLSINKDGCMEV